MSLPCLHIMTFYEGIFPRQVAQPWRRAEIESGRNQVRVYSRPFAAKPGFSQSPFAALELPEGTPPAGRPSAARPSTPESQIGGAFTRPACSIFFTHVAKFCYRRK